MPRISVPTALIAAACFALLAWSGWWWIAATAQKEGVLAWMEERRADGWAVEVADATVSGYPNRVDLTLSDMIVADPAAGWAWSAPMLQLLQLSYRPDQAILVFPPTQNLAAPGGRMQIGAAELKASASIIPGTDLRLRQAVLEGHGIDVSGVAAGAALPEWSVSAEDLIGALRIAESPLPEDGPHAYDVSATATNVAPPPALTGLLGLGEALPATAGSLKVSAVLGFDRPLGRAAAEDGGARPTSIRLLPSTLDWGPLSLRALGTLTIDAQGFPEGEIQLRAENWRAALEAAIAAGAVSRDLEPALRGALEIVAFIAGRGEGLEAPLRFADRTVFLGPAPVGPAPRLTLPR